MSAVPQYPQRHAVTTDEFLRMGEARVFPPEARLELLEGEIIEMPPIGSPHAGTVAVLCRLLERASGDSSGCRIPCGLASVPCPNQTSRC